MLHKTQDVHICYSYKVNVTLTQNSLHNTNGSNRIVFVNEKGLKKPFWPLYRIFYTNTVVTHYLKHTVLYAYQHKVESMRQYAVTLARVLPTIIMTT